jgi:hypothetical protein
VSEAKLDSDGKKKLLKTCVKVLNVTDEFGFADFTGVTNFFLSSFPVLSYLPIACQSQSSAGRG